MCAAECSVRSAMDVVMTSSGVDGYSCAYERVYLAMCLGSAPVHEVRRIKSGDEDDGTASDHAGRGSGEDEAEKASGGRAAADDGDVDGDGDGGCWGGGE